MIRGPSVSCVKSADEVYEGQVAYHSTLYAIFEETRSFAIRLSVVEELIRDWSCEMFSWF